MGKRINNHLNTPSIDGASLMKPYISVKDKKSSLGCGYFA